MVSYGLLNDVFKAWVLLDLLFIAYIIFIIITQNVSYRVHSIQHFKQIQPTRTLQISGHDLELKIVTVRSVIPAA